MCSEREISALDRYKRKKGRIDRASIAWLSGYPMSLSESSCYIDATWFCTGLFHFYFLLIFFHRSSTILQHACPLHSFLRLSFRSSIHLRPHCYRPLVNLNKVLSIS